MPYMKKLIVKIMKIRKKTIVPTTNNVIIVERSKNSIKTI